MESVFTKRKSSVVFERLDSEIPNDYEFHREISHLLPPSVFHPQHAPSHVAHSRQVLH